MEEASTKVHQALLAVSILITMGLHVHGPHRSCNCLDALIVPALLKFTDVFFCWSAKIGIYIYDTTPNEGYNAAIS